MEKRLEGKVAIITGAGQPPGYAIGSGRAISVLFARAGARVMAVDRNFASAHKIQKIIIDESGEFFAFEADVTSAQDCKSAAEAGASRSSWRARAEALFGEERARYCRGNSRCWRRHCGNLKNIKETLINIRRAL